MITEQVRTEVLAALRRMAQGDFHIEIPPPEEDAELILAVNELALNLRRWVEEGQSLVGGDLSVHFGDGGELVDLLRDIQANLRHLVWQARAAAAGDLTQSVEAMGELAEVFNGMLRSLREAQDALMHKNDELDAINAHLQQLNQLKDDFLSIVSHDLRSPLTSIIGHAQLMVEEEEERELEHQRRAMAQRRALDAIVRAGNRQLDLVNDLLDLARIESGRITLSLQPGRIGDVLAESRDLMVGYAGDRRSEVELQVPVDEPEVRFDHARMLQVVNNLLSNAIKFTQPGERIECGLTWSTPGEITVYVRDHGQGIPLEEQPLIFDRFAQVRSEARQGMRGTGLGLAISKTIVELHSGRIWVESRPGEGSTFLFTLPLASRS